MTHKHTPTHTHTHTHTYIYIYVVRRQRVKEVSYEQLKERHYVYDKKTAGSRAVTKNAPEPRKKLVMCP
jgi:hypothetical protein